MRKFALPLTFTLTVVAAAGLGACASNDSRTGASTGSSPRAAAIKSETITEYQPGVGVVQAVTQAPDFKTSGAKASGASATAGDTRPDAMYRLAIKMEGGGVQYVDSQERYPVGTRVQLTPEKYIRKE